MSDATDIPKHNVIQFVQNIALLSQQRQSRLMSLVSMGEHAGVDAQIVQQFGPVEMNPVVGRFSDTPKVDTPRDSRWVSPQHFDIGDGIDKGDVSATLIDPTNPIAQSYAAAMNRKKDNIILGGFFTNAQVGEVNNKSDVAFPAANEVSSDVGGAGSGLNIAKLLAAQEILLANEVDFEDPDFAMGLAISQIDNSQLMRQYEVASSDFEKRYGIETEDGRVTKILGMTVVLFPNTRFTTNGAGNRELPMWIKSGMYYGHWMLPNDGIQVFRHTGKKNVPWIQADLKGGATRTEEAKVVKILV